MSTGSGLVSRVMLAVGGLRWVRIFRNNTGMAWVGKATKLGGGKVLIEDARPLHAGLIKGGADLIGWTVREIRPEHVGQRWAVFTAIEVKDGSGRANSDQQRFLQTVEDAGGIAGIARSEQDALGLVGREA